MSQQALQGKTIGVTRPRAQANELTNLISEQGGQAVLFPLLNINAVDTADEIAALDTAIAQLDYYALAIFVSPNAVDFTLPTILARRTWPPTLATATIGHSSVAALAQYDIDKVIAPSTRFDSEALLELPALQMERVTGRRIVIFRGNGGRELLATRLRERGATVDCITCYRRSVNNDSIAALAARWATQSLDALTISSSESLRQLFDRLDTSERENLFATPVFVPHQRIAETATVLGLRRVVLTEPADAGIISGLCTYNWRQS